MAHAGGSGAVEVVMPQPLLISLTPFATDPPHLGGQVVIRDANEALAHLGWRVEQFSLGLRRTDLAYLGRRRVIEVAPGYREHRATHPLLAAAFMRSAAAHLPFVDAGAWLDRVGWPELEAALPAATAVVVDHPWPLAPRLLSLRRGPLVLMAQNVEAQLVTGPLRARVESIERRAIAAADHVAAITSEDREGLSAAYGLDPSRLSVIARGIADWNAQPPDPEVRRQRRSTLGLADDELLAVFAGSRHGPNLDAARQVIALAARCGAPWRFLIAGSAARALPTEAGTRVLLRPGDPRPWLQCADLALNPMRAGSGLNIKMIEYLIAGLPVVTTPFGARGLAAAGTAPFWVADLAEWPRALAALAADPARRSQMGRAGRQAALAEFVADSGARTLSRLIWGLAGETDRQSTENESTSVPAGFAFETRQGAHAP